MKNPIDELRQKAIDVHKRLENDLRHGDPKAKGVLKGLGAELNAARESLGLSPLEKDDLGKK